tara:strand:+ start:7704 stop:8741 length:1038 start_codon:yes stop_codon:yes gene_type:complete
MTGFRKRENSEAIMQTTNQRWEVDDTGQRVYMQDTTEKLSADKRCLAVRTRRRYSSYGGNQCSSKVSIKWGNDNLCKKCADELYETMNSQRHLFVHNHIHNNLLWDDPQEQWDAYLDGSYKLPSDIARAVKGYRRENFHTAWGRFGLEQIYTDAGKISPFAIEDQLEQRRRNTITNYENQLTSKSPYNSAADCTAQRNQIRAYLLLKAGGRLTDNFPRIVNQTQRGLIDWIDCNPYAVEDGIGLGDIRIGWTDECKLSNHEREVIEKSLAQWWWAMSNLRITDEELTDLATWYDEFQTVIREHQALLEKMTEQYKEDTKDLDHKTRRFPWLPEPETEKQSVMDLE